MPLVYDPASITSIVVRRIKQKKKGKEYETTAYVSTVPFKEKGRILWIKVEKVLIKDIERVINKSQFPIYLAIILPPTIERNLSIPYDLARQLEESLYPFVITGIDEESVGKWHITFVINEEIFPSFSQSDEDFIKWNDELFRRAQKKLKEGWILEETLCLGFETLDNVSSSNLHECIRIYDPKFKPKLFIPVGYAYDYDPFENRVVYKILYTIDDLTDFTYNPFIDYGSAALFSSFKERCDAIMNFVRDRLNKAGHEVHFERVKEDTDTIVRKFKDIYSDIIDVHYISLENGENVGYMIKDKEGTCRLIIKRKYHNYLVQP